MTVFVDTSAWIALFKPDDEFHARGRAIWERLKEQASSLITSDWVFVETMAYLTRRLGRRVAHERGVTLLQSTRLRLVHMEPALFHRAWDRLGQAQGDLSLVDCGSFSLMEELGVTRAFTFDDDFARAGFTPEPS